MKIHPTAIVDPEAQLADGVEIQAYSIIGGQVRLGADTVIGPHCVIEGRTVIGERNRVFSGAQIGVVSQDLKHRPDLVGRVEIGNDNFIREHVTISASTHRSEEDEHLVTTIGSKCMFMACTHVAHDCHVGNSVIMANGAVLAGHVRIEDKVTIGGLTGVHQECNVGTMAFVGGMTRAAKDIPPYMLVEGVPPRCIGPNTIGLQRNGLDEAARSAIKSMYKLLYRSKLNATQALEAIEADVAPSAFRDHFIQFVKQSKRGVLLH